VSFSLPPLLASLSGMEASNILKVLVGNLVAATAPCKYEIAIVDCKINQPKLGIFLTPLFPSIRTLRVMPYQPVLFHNHKIPPTRSPTGPPLPPPSPSPTTERTISSIIHLPAIPATATSVAPKYPPNRPYETSPTASGGEPYWSSQCSRRIRRASMLLMRTA
jgi:hypothetical protein